MGVIITEREYKNRYRPEIVDWLLGNVGDWQTLTLSCEFSVEKKISQTSPLLIENSGSDLVLGDGTEWNEYGFDTGDVITLSFEIAALDGNGQPTSGFPLAITETRTIDLLQGDRITINSPWVYDVNMLPYNNGQARIDKVEIYVDKQPQGAEIRYGHLVNSEVDSGNLASFIDGTTTRIIAEYMDSLTGWQDCGFIGLQSGLGLRSSRWIYDGKEGTHTYKYRFEIEFLISSFFEELENFETMTAPSQVFGAESLTDNFEIIGFPEWNNPNTQIKSDKGATKRLGNTGWFNENFNGLDNDFTVLSFEYFDVISNEPTQRLSYGAETKIKAVIQGVPNLANGLTKLGIGFIFLPEEEEIYKNLDTPFQQNLFINTAGGVGTGIFTPSVTPSAVTYTGFTNVSGVTMNIRGVHFYIQGGNLVYEAILSPTAGFSNYIEGLDEAERNYALWVSVGDNAEVTNFMDRVSLLLDFNTMDLFIPPVGEFDTMSIGFVEHPYNGTEARTAGCGAFKVEDDLLAVIPFKLDITEDIPVKMEFVLEVENIASGIKYELQRYAVDLTGYPMDGAGVPQWNYDEERGFKLGDDNNKNWVKIQRDLGEDDGNDKGYLAYYGFKIRWEDWILRTGVPNDFFDGAEINNGFNNDWLQYVNNAGWDFNFTVYTYSTLNGNSVKYVNEEKLTFTDYDSNANIETAFSIIRESDSQVLSMGVDPVTGKPLGVLLKDERVRIKILYTKVVGNFADLSKYYGTICIEIDKGAGQFEFRQLSTIWESEGDNPLIPLDGETRTKKTLLANNKILLECLVEPTLLTEALRYKISSRLGCVSDCDDVVFTQDTKLMLFFDSSGSMDNTLNPLTVMRDTLLKDTLLPFYNNDGALYDASVTITNVTNERTMEMLNFLSQTPPTGNIVVMVFQDEGHNVYHSTTAITPRTAQYEIDILAFRNRLNSFNSGYYGGVIFQVVGVPLFKTFIEAIENGTSPYDGVNGLSDKSEIAYYYDITDGGTPQYYLDKIVLALQNLGYSI